MSAQAITHVWDIRDVSPEEKLMLLWVANNSAGLGCPVMIEPHGMGEFICSDIDGALTVLDGLTDKGLIIWGTEEDETSSYIWLAYDGPYDPPIDFTQETKSRSKRVAALIERDGPQCRYCDCTPVVYHVDHFIPRARGGADKMSNLVLACAGCNMAKRVLPPEDFLRDRPELLRSILCVLAAEE